MIIEKFGKEGTLIFFFLKKMGKWFFFLERNNFLEVYTHSLTHYLPSTFLEQRFLLAISSKYHGLRYQYSVYISFSESNPFHHQQQQQQQQQH
jgi:hypothetical protein